ncbi:MAG: hypothetical protein ACXWV9_10950, partial [Flavisolibacter sp.]
MQCSISYCFSGIILTGSEGKQGAGSRKQEAVGITLERFNDISKTISSNMIKKESVHRLITNKVVPPLEKKLTPYNFKYNKGRQAFIKKAGEYEIEIELPKYFGSIEYDDNSGLIYLVFNLYTSIRIPNYSKWYEKNFGNKFNFSSSVSHIKLFTILEFSDFSESDFFTPSKAVAFKIFVSGTLRNNM